MLLARYFFCALILLACACWARADAIAIHSAELIPDEEHYLLNAEFEFSFSSTLEQALHSGITLDLVIEFEIGRPRWYWFDEKVAEQRVRYRLSYRTLTRQYRLASGLYVAEVASLEDVVRLLSRIKGRSVVEKSLLKPGVRYEAALRFGLDTSQLPKPFQVDALASRDWHLQSDWRRWIVVP